MEQKRQITVSKMTENDVPAVAFLERECFSSPWSEKSLRESLKNEGAVFLCAMEDGNLLGYIGASVVLDEAYVSDLAVSKAARRKGVGTELLSCCERLCRERGSSFLSLEVRKSNAAAVALYQKAGFASVGERKNFYSSPREDAIIMTKYF